MVQTVWATLIIDTRYHLSWLLAASLIPELDTHTHLEVFQKERLDLSLVLV